MKRKVAGISCILFALSLLINAFSFPLTALASKLECTSINECINQKDEANKEIQNIQNEIQSSRKKIDVIKASLSELEAELGSLYAKEDKINEEIDETESKIEDLEKEVERNNELVKGRMEIMQTLNNGNAFLDFIFGATSITDLFRRTTATSKLNDANKEAIDSLQSTIEEVQKERAKLQVYKDEVKQLISDQNEVKNEYNKKIQEEEKLLLSQEEEEELIKQQQSSIDKILEQLKDNADEEKEENTGSSNNGNSTAPPSVGGNFSLPAQGGYISCEWGCYPGHKGIDIANSAGTPILASASGIVTYAGWHNQYGNYITIAHKINGKAYYTLYAHMSSLYVSSGQSVKNGQKIGAMGSTGNSTGNHLHFEIHVGSLYNRVNPRAYVNFPSRW